MYFIKSSEKTMLFNFFSLHRKVLKWIYKAHRRPGKRLSTLRLTGKWITVVWYIPSFLWKVFVLHYHMKKEKVGQVSFKKEFASSNGVQFSFRFRVAKSIQLSGTKIFKQIFFITTENLSFEWCIIKINFWYIHIKLTLY